MPASFTLTPALHVLAIVGFSLCGLLSLVALLVPRLFQRLAQRSSQWVDSERLLAVLDKRIDIDAYVLRYTRLFGAAMLFGLCAAFLLYTRRG